MSRNPYLAQRYGVAFQQLGEQAARAQEESDVEYDAAIGYMRFPQSTYMTCTVFKPSTSSSRVPGTVVSESSTRLTPPSNATGRNGYRHPRSESQLTDGFTPLPSRSSSASGALPPLLSMNSKSSSPRRSRTDLVRLTDRLRNHNKAASSSSSSSSSSNSSRNDNDRHPDYDVRRNSDARADIMTGKDGHKDGLPVGLLQQNGEDKGRLDGSAVDSGVRQVGLRGSAPVKCHDATATSQSLKSQQTSAQQLPYHSGLAAQNIKNSTPLLPASTSDPTAPHRHSNTEAADTAPRGSASGSTTIASSNCGDQTSSAGNGSHNTNGKSCARLAAPWAPDVIAPAPTLLPHSPNDALDFVSPLSGLVEATFPRVTPAAPPPLVALDEMPSKTHRSAKMAATGTTTCAPDRASSPPSWRSPRPRVSAEESTVAHYALLTRVANPAALVARRRQRRLRLTTPPLAEGKLQDVCRAASSHTSRQDEGLAGAVARASVETLHVTQLTPSRAPHTPPRLTLAEQALHTQHNARDGAGVTGDQASSRHSPGHAIPMTVFNAVMEKLTDFLRAGHHDTPRRRQDQSHTLTALAETGLGSGNDTGDADEEGRARIVSDVSPDGEAAQSPREEKTTVRPLHTMSTHDNQPRPVARPSQPVTTTSPRRMAAVPPPRVLTGRPFPLRVHKSPIATSSPSRQQDHDRSTVRGAMMTMRGRLAGEVITPTSELAHVNVGHAAPRRRSVSQRRLPSYAQPTESWLSKGVEQEEMTVMRLPQSVVGELEAAVQCPVGVPGGGSRTAPALMPRL